jgi:predicted phosphodiesterase
MRYGIFSDVHANLEALEAVIEAYRLESVDQFLCVGDIVGYAANPRECIEKTRALCAFIVAGNHDWGSVDLFPVDYFNSLARQAIFWTKNNLDEKSRHFLGVLKLVYKNPDLTLVHGTLDAPQDFNYMTDDFTASKTLQLQETDACFVGHSHIAGVFTRDSRGYLSYAQDDSISIKSGHKYIINVGSIGQPRDGNPKAAYCIYDTDKKSVEIKRVGYDIQAAREKIIKAGLPQFLADRLLSGM